MCVRVSVLCHLCSSIVDTNSTPFRTKACTEVWGESHAGFQYTRCHFHTHVPAFMHTYLLSQVSERTIYIVPKSTDESGRITHIHTCKYEITSRRVYSSLLYTKRSSKSIDLETFKRTFAPRVLLLILIFFAQLLIAMSYNWRCMHI